MGFPDKIVAVDILEVLASRVESSGGFEYFLIARLFNHVTINCLETDMDNAWPVSRDLIVCLS